MDEQHWLNQAVEMAVRNVAEGGGPFGAVVVRDDAVVATGQNRVTRDLDPTAHAEVVAIRTASRTLGSFSLEGCTLFTSCEPCPLCLAASLWARLDRVVYAADRHAAADGGFDDRAFYDLFDQDRASWPMPVVAAALGATEGHDPALAPFRAWLDHGDRTAY